MKRPLHSIIRTGIIAALIGAVGFTGGVIGSRFGSNTDNIARINPTLPLDQSDHQAQHVLYTDEETSTVARTFQEQFRRVSAETLPVVVEINVVNRVTRSVQPNPFEFFFGQPNTQPQEREFESRGMGSGVIVGRDGDTVYVLTNNHVAGEADEIQIGLYDGQTFKAELVGGDELIDLAMLAFETDQEVPIARLGDSTTLQTGDWVFAVGNPLGYQSSITAGIVSATARTPDARSGISGITDYIQTDAAINRGNSGGALVNLDGEVVGINTWIASTSGGNIGLGFAIPVNNARRAIEDFIRDGEVAYSWLGVQVSTIDSEYITEFVGDEYTAQYGNEGAFISAIYDRSPAASSGLQPGDFVLKVDGNRITDSNDLVRTIANLEPGSSVPFEVLRNGEVTKITVRTGRRNDDSLSDSTLWPGVFVSPINEEVRERLEIERSVDGVVISDVVSDSRAQKSGLRRGDLIVAVNGTRVGSVSDFYTVLGKVDDEEIQFRVLRDGQELILGFIRPVA